MALKRKEISEIRKAIEDCHRPLIFFDDDCDGLTSFLQVYKFKKEGRGIPVKDSPEVTEKYAKKVEEYQPDLVIILDKPYVSEDFIRKVSQKIIWLDHHEPQDTKGINYYNPRIHKKADNTPTSYWVYKILKKDLWIATLGTIADWQLPKDITKKFKKEYPDLLDKKIKTPEDAIFGSNLSKLIKIFSFNLKGSVKETMESIKILTRINDPYEILEQKTPRGKYIYKKYQKHASKYDRLLSEIKVTEEKLLVFTYRDDSYSYTADLSNEILYRHPEKAIIIGRVDRGEVKCSLRGANIDVANTLKECLKSVVGKGGGHTHACGARINEDDFENFVECFRKKISG